MEKEFQFKVQIQGSDLSDFMIYHSFTKFRGIFGLLLSIFAAVMLFMNIHEGAVAENYILFGVAMLFTVVNPSTLKLKGRAQAATNPVYKQPLHYKLDKGGMTVSQNDVEQTMAWHEVRKVRTSRKHVFVYKNNIHASIIPKRCLDGKANEIVAFIVECVADAKKKSDKESREDQ